MTKSAFYYKNIFLYASLQFCGNIEEYFKEHTQYLVVFIVMPRVRNKFNLVRYYEKGKLIEEKRVRSSNNIFLYYLFWYVQYLIALLHYFPRREKIIVITFHPLSFFLMHTQKLFRNIEYVYWIGDYFPGINISLKIYEKIKKFFHENVSYACYLSNRINEKMNGKVVKTDTKKTVMWGVKPKKVVKKLDKNTFKILFVGLIKPSQGIENIFSFLKTHKGYEIKVLGVCEQGFYTKLKKMIKNYKIEKQVYFPNAFLSDEDLEKESRDCNVGVALYDVSPLNATYYADPGKVKSYAEMQLPIVMSNISDVTYYINKFNCGEVIENAAGLESAFTKVKKNYKKYQDGLKKFNEYFYYETYYKKSFSFLEKLW